MKIPGRPVRSEVKANTPPPLPLSGSRGVEVGVTLGGGILDGVAEGRAVGAAPAAPVIAVGTALAGPAQPQASAMQRTVTNLPELALIIPPL